MGITKKCQWNMTNQRLTRNNQMTAVHKKKILANKLFLDVKVPSAEYIPDKLFKPKSFKAGSYIIEENKPNTELFLISSGKVNVLKKDHKGEPIEIASRGANDFVGEISLIENKLPSASIRCETEVQAFALNTTDFFTITDLMPPRKR